MEKTTKISLIAGLILSFSVQAQTAPARYIPPSEYISKGQFDALFGTISENAESFSRDQSLGTLNTFLGRGDLNSAIANLNVIFADACVADEEQEQSGSAWMLDNAKDIKVLMFNENHLTLASRTFVRSHLHELKAQGFTHIGFEALPAGVEFVGPDQAIGSGYYTIEPMFSALFREANRLGMTIFGYESRSADLQQFSAEEQRHAREQFQSQNIIKVIDSAPASSKFIIFGGWSHIAEEPLPAPGPSGEMRWMASLFREQSGIDPLTIELTKCMYESDHSEAWQGKIFLTDDGSSLVQGQYEGAVDAQIYLPEPAADTPHAASYYRSAMGKPVQIPVSLRSDSFPVLVQARVAGSEANAFAHDRILLQPGEDYPLYLNVGDYELTSYKGDGSVIGIQRVHIE